MSTGVASVARQETSKLSGSRVVHAGFVLTGMVTTLLGPILPALSVRWSLVDRQAGYLFTAEFVGSLLGSTLTSRLLPAWGFRSSLVLGLVLMAGGVATLAVGPWALGVTAVLGYGVGLGIVIPAANLLVADNSGESSAAALNILNFCWSAGAVACPFAVMLAQRVSDTRIFLVALSLLLGLTAVQMRFSLQSNNVAAVSGERSTNRVRGAKLAVLAALFFLYVGTENAVGGWVASYAQRLGPVSKTWWTMTPSLFWGTLLLGRVLAPVVLRRVRPGALASAGLVLSTGAIAFLILFTRPSELLVAVGLAGLGLAAVFPLFIARAAEALGGMASRMGGLLFACGSLGGASLPWLVGWLSTWSGSLRTGFLVALVGSAGMLLVQLLMADKTIRD